MFQNIFKTFNKNRTFLDWIMKGFMSVVLKVSKFQNQKYLSSILPIKNELNICQNLTYLLGQKFFVRFLGELRKNIFAFKIY